MLHAMHRSRRYPLQPLGTRSPPKSSVAKVALQRVEGSVVPTRAGRTDHVADNLTEKSPAETAALFGSATPRAWQAILSVALTKFILKWPRGSGAVGSAHVPPGQEGRGGGRAVMYLPCTALSPAGPCPLQPLPSSSFCIFQKVGDQILKCQAVDSVTGKTRTLPQIALYKTSFCRSLCVASAAHPPPLCAVPGAVLSALCQTGAFCRRSTPSDHNLC